MAELNVDSRPLNELSICCWNWKGGSQRNAEKVPEETKTQMLTDELRRHEEQMAQNEEKRRKAVEKNQILVQKLKDILICKEEEAALLKAMTQKLKAMTQKLEEEIRRQDDERTHILNDNEETRCSEEKQTQALKNKIRFQEEIVNDTTQRRQIIDTVFDDVCDKFIETGSKHPCPDIMLVTEASDSCLGQIEEQKQKMVSDLDKQENHLKQITQTSNNNNKEKKKIAKSIQKLRKELHLKEEKRTKKLKDNQPEVYKRYGGRFVAYESTELTTQILPTDKQMLFWSDRLKRLRGRQLQLTQKAFSNRLFVNVLSPDVDNPAADVLVCGWHGPASKSMKNEVKRDTFNDMMKYVSDLCPTCDNVDSPSLMTRNRANGNTHENCNKFAMRIVLGDFNYEIVKLKTLKTKNFKTKSDKVATMLTLADGLNMHGHEVCSYVVDGTLKKNRYDKVRKRAVIIDYILCSKEWSLLRSFAVPYHPDDLASIIGRDKNKDIIPEDYAKIRVLSDHPPIACTLTAPEGLSLFRPVPSGTENNEAGPDNQSGSSNDQQELQETTTALQDLNLNPPE